MTLTEFLLARIAEDEAEASDWPTDGNWGLHPAGVMWMDPNGRPIYAPRSRVLVECQAKRVIVGLRERIDQEIRAVALDYPAVADMRATRLGLDLAIKMLATPYAEHPDYREEWRP